MCKFLSLGEYTVSTHDSRVICNTLYVFWRKDTWHHLQWEGQTMRIFFLNDWSFCSQNFCKDMALLDTKLGMYQMQGNPDSQSPEEMGMDEKEPLLLQASSPSLEESSPPHITMWWVRDRDLWRLTESPKWMDYSKIEFRQGIYFIFLINYLLFFFKTLSCNIFLLHIFKIFYQYFLSFTGHVAWLVGS